ncbi:MAG TPA: hypothetical protein PKH77_00755 [Anaerolineae bacterium]|nr:hypothetical protein [Anaerolineae bacterium]
MTLPDEACLEVLIERCQRETVQYRQPQPSLIGYCLELFRRAIVEGSQAAWQAVYEQYRGQMARWARADPDKAEDIVQSALEKFVRRMTPDRFTRFTGVAHILAYLERCIRSVRIDRQRQEARESAACDYLQTDFRENDPVRIADERIENTECARYIYSRLHDDQERAVVRLNLELDLKPAEIARLYPQLFPTTADVHRIRERVIRRLADDPVLQKYRDDN